MKIRFKVARGNCVTEYCGSGDIDEVVELLKRDEVISLSVVKQTPRQYFDAKIKKNKTANNERTE